MMRRMSKLISLAWLIFAIFWFQCGDEKNPTAPEPQSLDDFIKNKMEQARIPGLAAAIVTPGKVVWTAGYGFANLEAQRAVTPETAFSMGSVSKTVLAVALMQAWEQGALSPDSNINDMLPFTVDNPHADGEVITLRHLATHTSGIIDNWDVYIGSYVLTGDSPIALGDFVKGYLVEGGEWYDANKNYAAVLPGQQYSYSNIAAGLAGYLIETTTGTPLDDHSDTNIFGALGMTNTGWRLSDFSSTDNIAVPYELNNGSYQAIPFFGYPTWPDGGLRASVADMARFLAAVMNGGELEGARILNESTVKEMLRSQIPALGKEQGIFWDLEGEKIGHNGDDPGASTFLFFQPATGVGAIVLMNMNALMIPDPEREAAIDQAGAEILQRLFESGLELNKSGSGYQR